MWRGDINMVHRLPPTPTPPHPPLKGGASRSLRSLVADARSARAASLCSLRYAPFTAQHAACQEEPVTHRAARSAAP